MADYGKKYWTYNIIKENFRRKEVGWYDGRC